MPRFIPILVLMYFAGVASGFGAPANRPNILLMVVDDLNVDFASFDRPAVKSPNIDRLVNRGVKFERAYTQFPLCSPSRESFLSGLRPETSGSIIQPIKVRDKRPTVAYLPRHLRAHGYSTLGVGKIFHRNDADSWDEYDSAETQSAGEAAAGQQRSELRERGANGPAWHPLNDPDEKTGDGIVARKGVTFLERAAQGEKPFLVATGFRKPHLPWTAPRKYFERNPASAIALPVEPAMIGVPQIALYTDLTGAPMPRSREEAMAAYYACVSFIDAQIGLLLDTMDRLRLWENTVVVFFSDHGFHLGDHGGLWAKLTNFERSARVPMVWAGAGVTGRGASRGIVELLDVYPTLLELCGLPGPPDLEGRSVMPLLVDPAAKWKGRAYTTTIHLGVMGRSIRTDRWRFTEWSDGQSIELYDHRADPGEYRNLAKEAAFAMEVGELRRELAKTPRIMGPIPADAETPREYKKKKK